MRANEIKFRVWDGNLMYQVGELYFCAGGTKWYGPGVGTGWCLVNAKSKGPIPKTDNLMRNTGILDSNNEEIWEDDIVKVEYEPTLGEGRLFYGTIYNDNGLWMIDFQNDGVSLCISGPEYEDGIESIEIIGNIWENKDLFDSTKMELLVGKTG